MTDKSINNSPIEYFSIHGLHGERDVRIDFKTPVKIFISENGKGKTTTLRIFNNFFSKSHRISKDNFDCIIIKKKNHEPYTFHRQLTGLLFSDILPPIIRGESHQEKHFFQQLKAYEKSLSPINIPLAITILLAFASNEKISEKDISREFTDVAVNNSYVSTYCRIVKKIADEAFNLFYLNKEQHINIRALYYEIAHIFNSSPKQQVTDFNPIANWMDEANNYIKNINNFEIIYLPTYRLIESNIINFKDSDNDLFFEEAKEIFDHHPLIHFGTEKIEKTWNEYSSEIRESTTVEFQKLSSKLLMDFVEDKIKHRHLNISIKAALSSLNKLNNFIYGDEDKNKIRSFIKSKYNDHTLKEDDSAFFYILNYLSNIHSKQSATLEKLNNYSSAINSFFSNKKVIIDEYSANISIEKSGNNLKISPEDLSSGEKQILSLFTRLFLDKNNDKEKSFWIIYDEPELSLSIEWQRILLPQIMKSGKCSFILCATHSPFIFDNELAIYTSDLSIYNGEVKDVR
ncbi:hypothetical protein ACW5WN_06000 [Aeromonas lacus]